MTAFADTVLADPPLSTRLQDFLRPRGWRADFSSVVLPQEPAASATPVPSQQGAATPEHPRGVDEPGPEQASQDPPTVGAEPVTGPGGTPSQSPAPGAAPEVTEPAVHPAGGGQPEAAPGAETGDEVTPEEVEAEFGPLPPERCGLLLPDGGTCHRLAHHEGDCDPQLEAAVKTGSDEEASGVQDAPAEAEAEAGK